MVNAKVLNKDRCASETGSGDGSQTGSGESSSGSSGESISGNNWYIATVSETSRLQSIQSCFRFCITKCYQSISTDALSVSCEYCISTCVRNSKMVSWILVGVNKALVFPYSIVSQSTSCENFWSEETSGGLHRLQISCQNWRTYITDESNQ